MALEEDGDSHLEKGLEAGFGGPAPGEADSVLARLEESSGIVPRVLLDDPAGDPSPVVMPGGNGDDGALPRVLGPYQVVGEIARGGVGVVLKGRDVDLGRDVALKLLRPELEGEVSLVQRFVEEAQIEGQLTHPGIVPIYGIGLEPGGRPYFAMKLVKGETLSALLAKRRTPGEDRRRFLGIFEQVAQTVAYAHARHVVHRDIKPANVLVGSFGEVQVVDWGFAKVLPRGGTADERLAARSAPETTIVRTVRTGSEGSESQAGSVMGTPPYMPPEQALGDVERLDARSDVFSLGAVLAEILTTKPPYVREDGDVFRQAAGGKLEPCFARLAATDADPELVAMTRRCLSSEPENRYRDAGEVAEVVGAYLASVEERAREAQIAAAEARVKAEAERKKKRLTVALAASVLLAVFVGGGAYLWRSAELRSRAEETGRAVARALGEAQELWGEARRSAVGDLTAWESARAAAAKAVEVAETGGAEDEVAEGAHALMARIEEGREEARALAARKDRDEAMLDRVRAIRLRRGTLFLFLEVEAEYAEAFREYGIDADGGDLEAAAIVLKESTIAGALCAALDDWALVRTRYSKEEAEKARRLTTLANSGDPDAWRVRVRQAVAARDAARLEGLRREANPADRSPGASLLLAEGLTLTVNTAAGVEVLTETRRRHPDDFWVLYQLGFWLANLPEPRPPEALECFSAALALNPGSVEVRMQAGAALRRLSRDAEAIGIWEELLARQPDHNGANLQLFRTLRDRGQLPGRLPALEAAARDAPDDPFPHWRLGLALRLLGRVDEAIERTSRAIEIRPDYARAHFQLGFMRHYPAYRRVDLLKAHESIQAAARLEPGNPMFWQVLARCRNRLGRPAEAAEAWEQAVRAGPEAPFRHIQLTTSRMAAGDVDGAIAAYEGLAERFPDEVALADVEKLIAWHFVREGYRRLPRTLARRAIDRLTRALDQKEEMQVATTCHWISILHCDVLDDFEEGARWMRRVLELMPDSAGDLVNLGLATGKLGLPRDAIEILARAVKMDAKMAPGWFYLGWDQLVTGDHEGALASLDALLAIEPEHSGGLFCSGFALLGLGRHEEALARLRRHRAASETEGEAVGSAEEWEEYCAGIDRADRLRTAIRAGEAGPGDAREQLLLAECCLLVSEYDLACVWFERALAADPELARVRWPYWPGRLAAECAAVAAASHAAGLGPKAPSAAEQARLRGKALDWLRLALSGYEDLAFGRDAPPLKQISQALIEMRRCGALAPIREERHLATLPAEEARACRAFWIDMEALMFRVDDARR